MRFACVLAVGLAVGLVSLVAFATNEAERPKVVAAPVPVVKGGACDHEHLTVKSLTVRDGDGPAVTIRAMKTCAGIWLNDPKDPLNTVAIYFHRDQGAVVGVYDGRPAPLACGLALSGSGGESRIQAIDKAGKIHLFTVDDLLKLKK